MNGLPAVYIHTLDHLMYDFNCHNQGCVVRSLFCRQHSESWGDEGMHGDLNTQVKGLNRKEAKAKK